MRTVNYSIEKLVSRTESIPVNKEEILRITEDKQNRTIFCEIGLSNESGVVDKLPVIIEGDHYTLLMSDNSDFAPNKPENEYREIDLWHIVDLIR